MYIMLLEYVKPIEEVEKHLEDHIGYLEKYYSLKKFIFSGRRNPRIGGVILCKAESREELDSIMREDPFYINGIAKYDVVDFVASKYDERFACFAE